MSLENSPHFATSDDETQQQKRKISNNNSDTNSNNPSPNDDITETDLNESHSVKKKPKLRVGLSLVSYGLEDEEERDDMDNDTDESDHKENQPDEQFQDNFLTSDHKNENLNKPLTVFSSEHKVSDLHTSTNPYMVSNVHDTRPIPEEISTVESGVPLENNLEIKDLPVVEIELPPEVPGLCSMILQNKVDNAVRRMKLDDCFDPNRSIQDHKGFRNPSIYEKLISFLKIDEKGSNFPPDVYNPYRWSPLSYYDELSKVQNREIERLEKLRKDQKKVDASGVNPPSTTQSNLPRVVSGPNLSNSIDPVFEGSVATGFTEPKKRTKWDSYVPPSTQPGPPTSVDSSKEFPKTIVSNSAKINIPAVGSLVKKK